MTKIYLTALLCVLAIAACKSPQKIYDRGNYNEAIDRAVRKLQKDPNDAQARKVAKEAYADLTARYEGEIRNLLSTNEDDRFAQVYRRYSYLQGLYQSLNQSPAAMRAVHPTDYSSYLATYRDKAAEPFIERGRRWMQEDNKRAYREAYTLFRTAQEFKPNDFELQRLTEDAYRAAITVVLVRPMDTYGSNYFFSNASFQMRTFQERLIRQLNNHTQSDFLRFATEWETLDRNIRPDQVMDMRLGRMRFGQPFDQSESRKVEKKVVVKETVIKKDSVVKEYQTVTATITTVRRTLVSEAGLLLTSRDDQNRIVWQDEFGGQHRWETKFVSWNGDERALSDADKKYINDNQPGNQRVPREDEIVDELLRQIQNDLALRLRNNFRRNF